MVRYLLMIKPAGEDFIYMVMPMRLKAESWLQVTQSEYKIRWSSSREVQTGGHAKLLYKTERLVDGAVWEFYAKIRKGNRIKYDVFEEV